MLRALTELNQFSVFTGQDAARASIVERDPDGRRWAAEATRWNVHEFHLNSEFYADFGTYDVSITLPKEFLVGAVGEKQGGPVPVPGGLRHRFVQGDVHDFAFAADSAFQELRSTYEGEGSPRVDNNDGRGRQRATGGNQRLSHARHDRTDRAPRDIARGEAGKFQQPTKEYTKFVRRSVNARNDAPMSSKIRTVEQAHRRLGVTDVEYEDHG